MVSTPPHQPKNASFSRQTHKTLSFDPSSEERVSENCRRRYQIHNLSTKHKSSSYNFAVRGGSSSCDLFRWPASNGTMAGAQRSRQLGTTCKHE
ncbi:unnamed protein product [Rhodiola kirilowii]